MLMRGCFVAVAALWATVAFVEADASSATSLKSCSRCRLLSGWGLGIVPENTFDTKTIKTVEGQVVSVQDLPSEGEVVGGVYVLLKTDEGNVAVRVGPANYVLSSGFSIEPYDNLTITGSEVGADDHKGILATQVKKNGEAIQLRSEKGVIAWK